jgi:hypothetical protein
LATLVKQIRGLTERNVGNFVNLLECGTTINKEITLEEPFQSSKLKIKNQKRLPVAKELGETTH